MTTKLGVFHPDTAASYESWLGKPLDIVHGFVDPTSQLTSWQDLPQQVLASVELRTPIQDGANNAFDALYAAFGSTLVQRGQGDAIIRLGWEFNARWVPWHAVDDPASFRRYYKNVVRAMRTVPGQSFKFDWCVWCNPVHMSDPTLAYPGDEFVNFIGIDVYDLPSGLTDQERIDSWKVKANGAQGLDYWQSFAASHGKRTSIPEWGLVTTGYFDGGGDSPYFVDKVTKWADNNNSAYHCYFNTDATGYGLGDHRIAPSQPFPSPTKFPNAAARYRAVV